MAKVQCPGRKAKTDPFPGLREVKQQKSSQPMTYEKPILKVFPRRDAEAQGFMKEHLGGIMLCVSAALRDDTKIWDPNKSPRAIGLAFLPMSF
jgi:hypothetical protein